MYKLTCFAPIEPETLEKSLKGIHFKTVKQGFEWSMDQSVFRIEPFKHQPRDSMKAYRVYFNCDINGGAYLFDLSLGCLGSEVTGIEFTLEHPTYTKEHWLKEMRKRKSWKMIDPRGLYLKGDIGIVLNGNSVIIQLHSPKNKKLRLIDSLREIDCILEDLTPVEYDLFSFSEEIA